MKTGFLKNTLLMASVLLIFNSCKKDKDENSSPVTAEDLAGYYMAGELGGGSGVPILFAFYFQQESGGVSVTYDLNESRRGGTVTLTDGKYTFDVNDNGIQTFSFEFKKEGNTLKLVNADYVNTSVSDRKLQHVVLASKASAGAFAGKTFRQGDNANSYMKFSADSKWDWNTTGNFSTLTRNYYSLASPAIGWKGDGNHMGIIVPSWKNGQGAGMLVQRERESLVFFVAL